MTTQLTVERLREILDYDPTTGLFTWKNETRWRGMRYSKGDPAGSPHAEGYVTIAIDGRKYLAHRLAWFYVAGVWPEGRLDHRNMNRNDNRWENLRRASAAQNGANRVKGRNNTSGFKGVSWDKKKSKWASNIMKDRKNYFLGYFRTPEEAHAAYVIAADRLHGQFARAA